MLNIFIIVALLVLFFVFAQKYLIKEDNTKDYAYRNHSPVLTATESTFYRALTEAVGEHGVVFAKVNMAQLLIPVGIRKKKDRFIATNRIAKHYFQFVVCDPRTFEPRVVIELDNGKALNKPKAEREKLLLHVCRSANIPLIGTNIRYSYQVSKLRRLLATHIDLIESDKEVRFCKKCGSPMVVRVANQGEFKGRRFFTCSRQPQCNYVENYNVVYEDDDAENENEEAV
jgi:ssDNA-binding Zn-finger/Zn-ribbon topoisomerase 1